MTPEKIAEVTCPECGVFFGTTDHDMDCKTGAEIDRKMMPEMSDLSAKRKTDTTSIEWVIAVARSRGMRAAVWNPIAGCAPAGEGCRNCWAAAETHMRRNNQGVAHFFSGLTKLIADGRPVFNGTTRLVESEMTKPLHTTAPTVYFVCSRSDLFGEGVSDEQIDRVYAVMALRPQHMFLVLTKRAERIRKHLTNREAEIAEYCPIISAITNNSRNSGHQRPGFKTWPLHNIWHGVSIWDQPSADRLVPGLLATPSALRFVSAEPLLGTVDLTDIVVGPVRINALAGVIDGRNGDQPTDGRLDWVIAGGESGPGARPMHPDWARSLRDQCAAAGVPYFFKQWGAWHSDTDGRCPLPEMRVGKKAAGRLLDGWAHLDVPSIPT
jgi:protein gp37